MQRSRQDSLTRRELLALGALAGAATALEPLAASAAPPPGEIVMSELVPAEAFHEAVPRRAAAAAVETARSFCLVGVEWLGAPPRALELRARRRGGPWSRWVPAGPSPHGPDGPGRGRTVGEPVWVGRASALELRLEGPPRELRVHFVDERRPPRAREAALTARPLAPLGVRTEARAPRIVPRSAWAHRAARPRRAPRYGEIAVGFVHHTATANDYSPAESAAAVLAIYHFHRDVRGWDDIGYNFLVDRYGRIFEGRAGGADEPVVGAQAGGYNTASTGVALIGDFGSLRPPHPALAALERLLAWKLPLHGVPVQGHTRVISAGGPYTAHRRGTPVRLNRIAGHRDADSTDCPGGALYRHLSRVRRSTARRARRVSRLVISVPPRTLPAPALTPLSGVLELLGSGPVPDAPIEVRAAQPGGGEETVAAGSTGQDGTFQIALFLGGSARIRVVFPGNRRAPGCVSSPVLVRVGA